MRKLIYSMGVSLDGFIVGDDGKFDWAAPDEELHRFHNAQARELGAQLYGRRMYETMVSWDTVDESAGPVMADFGRIWRDTPKIVFSTTLDGVEGTSTTLASDDPVTTAARLKAEEGEPLAVGGATLAASLIAAGLVDEYGLFVNPVIVGGGTPFFPRLDRPLGLELLETRTFGNRVVYARYAAAP